MKASSAGRAPVVEHRGDVVDAERAVRAALDPAPRRHPCPGQQVGVVLDDGRGDHVVGSQPEAVGEMVDGLGRVAHEDDHVVAPVGRPAKRYTLSRAAS